MPPTPSPPRRAAALGLVMAVVVGFLFAFVATTAAAQELPDGSGINGAVQSNAAAADLPVSIGRPGATPLPGAWASDGLAVPALLAFSSLLLCIGAALLWQRCRLTSARSGSPHPSLASHRRD